MNVLSLFDGISCGHVALDRAGINVKAYYSSEIDENAITVSKRHYPQIKRLGDVKTIKTAELPKIDLMIFGSPCQDLSIAKKGRKGLAGDRSGLFWVAAKILKEIKPIFFLMENVVSMNNADRDTISTELGVQPIMINASLVSAQCRKRYFWTNIPVKKLEDKKIMLKDILLPEAQIADKLWVKGKTLITKKSLKNEVIKLGHYEPNSQGYNVYSDEGKATTVLANGGGLGANTGLYKIGHIGETDAQANRVYSIEGKSQGLIANAGGLGGKTGLYAIGHEVVRRLDNDGKRCDADTTIPYTRRVECRTDEKCGTLTTVPKDNMVVTETRIRKLDPIECERLQGLPDNYTLGIATTNRLKALGNAFNVDVITHIVKGMNSFTVTF